MLFGEEGGAFAAVVEDHVGHGEGADADADYCEERDLLDWGKDEEGREREVGGGERQFLGCYKGGKVPVNPTNV